MFERKLAIFEPGRHRKPGTMVYKCRRCSQQLVIDTKKLGHYHIVCIDCASEKELESSDVVKRKGYRQQSLAQL